MFVVGGEGQGGEMGTQEGRGGNEVCLRVCVWVVGGGGWGECHEVAYHLVEGAVEPEVEAHVAPALVHHLHLRPPTVDSADR